MYRNCYESFRKRRIERPNKGKKITREEYNETVKKKMEELREMFQKSGRGR